MKLGGGGGECKGSWAFLVVHFCTFSRTNVIRKLFHGLCCPWRLGRSRDYSCSLTHRPSEAPAPEGSLLSPGLASYSAWT